MIKRYKASVTIYLAMAFMVVVSLIVTLINYVSISSGIATIHMIDSMSVDSVFSEYDRTLFEEYGLFFLDTNEDGLSGKLMEYMTDNSAYNEGLMEFSADEVIISSLYTAGVDDGKFFERQVFDYTKYAAPIDAGISIVKELLGIKEESPTSKATDSLVELSEEVKEGAIYIYNLMSYLDGVETMDLSIVTDGMTVVSGETFAKAISLEKDPIGLGISTPLIYSSIMDKVHHPIEMLMELKVLMEMYREVPSDRLYAQIYDKTIEISDLFESTKRALSGAHSSAVFIKSTSVDIENKCDKLQAFLEENKENINDDFYESLQGELENFKDFDKKDVNGLCDAEAIIAGTERNENILSRGYFLSDILAALDNSLVFDIYMEQLDALILAMHDYRTDDLVIDYSGIDIFSKSNMSILNSLKGIYDRGILYLVAGEDKLSDKCVPLKYICGDGQKASFGEADEILRNVSFNEYVLNKFSSYTDKVTCNHLDYEIEYIISGKSSDRENLSNVCSEIIGLRTIPNLVYLFTDSVKCEEAESLAFLIAGSSGIPALVTAMKYVILSIWAYAESITDMKNLLSDKKVPILKSDDTFNMSLEKLLAMDFTLDKQSSYGMKYEDFLRLLLFLENYGRKNNTTMNLVDFHMINAGAGNFRIRNMVCGADIITKYTYNGGKKYIRSSTYSY